LQDSADACGGACKKELQCNIYVWCGALTGCGASQHKECWLKRQKRINYLDPEGNIGWSEHA